MITGVLPEEVVVNKAHGGTAGEEEEEEGEAPLLGHSDTTASLILRAPMHASTRKY